MGIGDWYVYTMEGIGEKVRIYRHFRKFVISSFFTLSGYSATTHSTWKTDFWPKKRQKQGYSLIERAKNSKIVITSIKNRFRKFRYLLGIKGR